MKTIDAVSGFFSKSLQSVLSILKLPLLSRRPFRKAGENPRTLIILGNGPSLRTTMDDSSRALGEADLLAVNFAANAPDFSRLRPEMYVLADPHFFNALDSDPNVGRLWENIASSSWRMNLYVPVGREIPISLPQTIRVKRYNLTPAEGFRALTHLLFSSGLAMPRPRNVLIPSIMIAMREGYRKILLAGADHSWSRTLWVDDENHVVSVQPHFYENDEKEKERVRAEYAGYHLHHILRSLTVAFSAYFDIRAYADKKGVEIINVTPGSFIDAFPRASLPKDKE